MHDRCWSARYSDVRILGVEGLDSSSEPLKHLGYLDLKKRYSVDHLDLRTAAVGRPLYFETAVL